jgi:hypothetical protein
MMTASLTTQGMDYDMHITHTVSVLGPWPLESWEVMPFLLYGAASALPEQWTSHAPRKLPWLRKAVTVESYSVKRSVSGEYVQTTKSTTLRKVT